MDPAPGRMAEDRAPRLGVVPASGSQGERLPLLEKEIALRARRRQGRRLASPSSVQLLRARVVETPSPVTIVPLEVVLGRRSVRVAGEFDAAIFPEHLVAGASLRPIRGRLELRRGVGVAVCHKAKSRRLTLAAALRTNCGGVRLVSGFHPRSPSRRTSRNRSPRRPGSWKLPTWEPST